MLTKRLQDLVEQLKPREAVDPWKETGLGQGGKAIASGLAAIIGGHYGGAGGIKAAGGAVEEFSNAGKKREAERIRKVKDMLAAEGTRAELEGIQMKRDKSYSDLLFDQERLKGERLSQKRTQQLIDSSKQADRVARAKMRLEALKSQGLMGGSGSGGGGSKSGGGSLEPPITVSPSTDPGTGKPVFEKGDASALKKYAAKLHRKLQDAGVRTKLEFNEAWQKGINGLPAIKDSKEIRKLDSREEVGMVFRELARKYTPQQTLAKMDVARARGGLEPDPDYGAADYASMLPDKVLRMLGAAGGGALGAAGGGALGAAGGGALGAAPGAIAGGTLGATTGRMAADKLLEYLESIEDPIQATALQLPNTPQLEEDIAATIAKRGNERIPGEVPSEVLGLQDRITRALSKRGNERIPWRAPDDKEPPKGMFQRFFRSFYKPGDRARTVQGQLESLKKE